MKPLLKIVDTRQNHSFQTLRVSEPFFFPSWHFHPEFEIMLVEEGTGIRFVGDSIERFQAGDLVLFGPNIPHLYRSDEEYYKERSGLLSKASVIYFKENFPGEHFWNMPEMSEVKRLLSQANQGIKFTGMARAEMEKYILHLFRNSGGMDGVIDLLVILKIMARTQDFKLLSGKAFAGVTNKDDCERINKVYQFILDHYMNDPTLEEVSKLAFMTTSAFCRYFKSHTNKTYVQFLNEVKIGNACKLLIDNKLTISQICFETGFNNFNHFNNQFKRITGFTPGAYQHRYMNAPVSKAG